MQLLIKVSNPSIKPRLVLQNKNHIYVGHYKLKERETIIDLDLDKVKYVFFKYGKKRTENIILSDNLEILDFAYNHKRKLYDVSISCKKEFNNVINEVSIDPCFKYRKKKNTSTYFSKDFKNEDVHLILFFDVQNIFNLENVGEYTKKNDPYKGWQVEVPIEQSAKNFIVFGIENADKHRTSELSPKVNSKYIRVENDDVKNARLDDIWPFLLAKINEFKANYNIVDVAIAGASMGGLASFYLGLKYSDIFDYIFSFSPATALYQDECWQEFHQNNIINLDQKLFYFIGGADALERRLRNWNQNYKKMLFERGFNQDNYYEYIDESLKHNEISWRYAFNYAFNLFYNK